MSTSQRRPGAGPSRAIASHPQSAQIEAEARGWYEFAPLVRSPSEERLPRLRASVAELYARRRP